MPTTNLINVGEFNFTISQYEPSTVSCAFWKSSIINTTPSQLPLDGEALDAPHETPSGDSADDDDDDDDVSRPITLDLLLLLLRLFYLPTSAEHKR